jgi:predicted transcriptional regulator
MPPGDKLGEAQLEILRYIQDHYPVTVRQVAAFLAEKRGLTRTTALNSMERLREKGYLQRAQVDGVYNYSPSQSKPSLLRGLVREFVAKSLGGSLEPFVAYLAEEARLTEGERAILEERIRQLRDETSDLQPGAHDPTREGTQ